MRPRRAALTHTRSWRYQAEGCLPLSRMKTGLLDQPRSGQVSLKMPHSLEEFCSAQFAFVPALLCRLMPAAPIITASSSTPGPRDAAEASN